MITKFTQPEEVNENTLAEQEIAGLKELLKMEYLPKFGIFLAKDVREDLKEEYESLGFIVEECDDELFYKVTYPEGYKLEESENRRWTRLYDADGDNIAMVYYNARFNDRRAHADFAGLRIKRGTLQPVPND